jgi:hypothetical protein
MNDEVGSLRGAQQRQLQQLIVSRPGARVATVRGEAGLGKTTLLTGLAQAGARDGWRVLRATGSPAEARLSLAGLHQLLRPLLNGADGLPAAQRAAFSVTFGPADDPIALAFGSRAAIQADLGPDSQTIDLVPLTAREANWLLDLQPAAPAGVTRAVILEQAAGNPLGLVELTRAAAADPAQAAGLVAISGGSATFSRPLIRTAVYQAASPAATPCPG